MASVTEKNVPSKIQIQKKLFSVGTGAVIGFLAASVLYSKNLPAWVPGFFAKTPFHFFGLFVLICAVLGYIWADTPSPISAEKKRRLPLFNVIFSGAFIGFLIAAVLYSKFLPGWVPLAFLTTPALFFALASIFGILVSLFWNRYNPQ